MTDEEIIQLFQRRDERALAAVQQTYGSYCFSVAMNILHNRQDSEECVNETLMRAWKAIPPQEPKSLRMFLAAVTRNLAFSAYRRDNAQCRGSGELELVLGELEECVAAPGSLEDLVLTQELDTEINRFLRTLSDKERDVFLRRYFFTESYREIAKRYRMQEASVRMCLTRTRKKLKKHLTKEGLYDDK